MEVVEPQGPGPVHDCYRLLIRGKSRTGEVPFHDAHPVLSGVERLELTAAAAEARRRVRSGNRRVNPSPTLLPVHDVSCKGETF